ncbi:hypothetical protein ACFVUY_37950 [Kitasatospora sp. NPDC058063]|uniref:hypothetical protein n=1 Tax=unclassified Kitasatospora TaxID=2633591 RepID=UPI0036DA3CC3
MPERYIATFEVPPPEAKHRTPDYSRNGWEVCAYSNLNPGPIGVVSIAVTEEETGREQTDVILTVDPAAGCSVRTRVHHSRVVWGEDPEIPEVHPAYTDAEGVGEVRLSIYGTWARRGMAAALREAAEMLEGAELRLPPAV